MGSFHGVATTTDAERVIRRLVKHWSHKYPTQLEEAGGTVQLNAVRVILRAEPGSLAVTLDNPDGEVPERLKGVVAEHLQRMAGAEVPLVVDWT